MGPSEYPLEQGSYILFIQVISINLKTTNYFIYSDNRIRIFSPGLRPRLMKSIYLSNIEQGITVNRMDVLDDHIVAAMPGWNITFWPGKVC